MVYCLFYGANIHIILYSAKCFVNFFSFFYFFSVIFFQNNSSFIDLKSFRTINPMP